MEELTNIKSYREFESTFDKELAKQAESFVKVGYLLKVARDTDILSNSGYGTVAEFAEKRYGLSKDVVSRYIRINDKFSEGGYSEHLAEQYKNFGYSKLAIMLTLPETVADALSPQMSKSEIVAVQKEIKEEQQITDLEVMLEEKQEVQQSLENDLQVFFHQYGYDEREKVQSLVNATSAEDYIEKILDILAPSGVNMLSVRIKGRGKLMLSIKGKDKPLELLDVRADSKQEFSWEELQQSVITVYRDGSKEAWETLYNEPYEEKVIEESSKEPAKEANQAEVQEQGEKVNVQKENTISESGSVVKLKSNCIAKEMKDELFKSWFNAVSDDKIENACKMMESMRFTDLINVTPKKLFLLVQTSEVSTEEIKKNGELLTKVEDGQYAGLFTAQDFLKRFTKKFLDPYKEKQSESNSVPESHKNVSEAQESDPKQSNIVSESTEEDEQIPGQKTVEDYPEMKPEKKLLESDYITIAVRCLPGDTVYFLLDQEVVEATVTKLTIGLNKIPMIEAKAGDPNIFMEFNQAEDWNVTIFKSREAALKQAGIKLERSKVC